MLIKSNWHWINFIFMILMNHMFQLGSADLNEDQIQSNNDMINLKFSILKQMANNLKLQQNNSTEKETGQFYRPGSRNSINRDKLNLILNRIENIEQNICASAGKDGDSETIKVRVNEIENLRQSLDNIFKENMQYQNKLEQSLANVTTAYNDMAKRLAILEEPNRLKELEEQLMKGDYNEAKLNADIIVHDDKIIDVMKKVYEEQKDIDGYLYFAGIVDNLSRRLLIYQYLFNDIISKANYQHINVNSGEERIYVLSIFQILKLISKLESSIIKMAPVSGDIYTSANNLTAVCKNITESFFMQYLEFIKYVYESKGFQNYISNISINNSAAVISGYDNSTADRNQILFQYGLYLDNLNGEIIDCWLNTRFLLFNRDAIISMMLLPRDKDVYIRSGNHLGYNYNKNVKLSNYGKFFLLSLKEQIFNTAVDIYNGLKSNNNEIVNAIKQYCNEFQNVDSILQFVDLLTHSDRVVIYNALYNAINKTDSVNICDMLKLHDSLINFSNSNQLLTIINNLKKAITLVIKNDLIRSISAETKIENYWNLVESDYNEISIYSKDDNKIIGKYKYYLVKENGKSNCYFDGKVSVNNYDNWFWKNGLITGIPWLAFIFLITKLCQFKYSLSN